MAMNWIAYNELAWVDDWLTDPQEYEEEVQFYLNLISSVSEKPLRTLLHMGCGAGGHDRVFQRHFAVTGVDISPGMLNKARTAHPEIEYLEGVPRTVRLNRQFDVVAIPDSIDYMVSIDDLQRAIQTAVVHLRFGGVLLVVAKTREIFQNNNFAYTGEKDGIHVTLLENNYSDTATSDTYEATLVYLIRKKGELSIRTERHVLGLFPSAVWENIFREAGLRIQATKLDGLYDRFLLGEGTYPLVVFTGQKTIHKH